MKNIIYFIIFIILDTAVDALEDATDYELLEEFGDDFTISINTR